MKAERPRKCQFNQHFTSSFFAQKFFEAFFYQLFGFVIFWQKNIGTKLLVNYW